MKIRTITIHNFRSIKYQAFDLLSYSLLVGANNSGKTNIIDALRIFYEKEKLIIMISQNLKLMTKKAGLKLNSI